MSIFQKVYDWFKNWTPPAWLRELIAQLNNLMIALLKEVSSQYIAYLRTKILEAAQHSDWTNTQKFNYVLKSAKEGLTEFGLQLKDAEINLLIEFLVNQLKKTGVI